MSVRSRLFATIPVAFFITAAISAPASADRDGYVDDDENTVEGTVTETVVVEGDTIPGGSRTETMSIPARCWWNAFESDEEFLSWWFTIMMWFPGGWVFLPDPDYIMEIYEESDPKDGRWYKARCVEDATLDDFETFLGSCQAWYPDACIPQLAVWWEDTESEPPVVIQPEELALAASALIEIPNPEVDQNPKAAGTENTTVVNIPTGYWVLDPDAVGGEDGLVEIRATIPETGTWVQVWASTDGLRISSPVGSTTCSPAEAVTAWTEGTDPACAVVYERASTQYPDGFPVTAETIWQTGWHGGIGDAETDSGDLDPISTEETFTVPVAEVQTIVR
ncbi:hypothetical protein [Phytoactinopolyspora mesophila]|uniref:Secreted protein n=1 Tax=Phytoactinopolyspora mesophila TaxID=2650750 RepID=A0A7K3M5R1_9ACTN|nr:hypothetical protein [Phytoactinopolyspora mesophila]NDL58550.1 hypothetical protein [Phytoactinopolyspora mesophila]